MAKGHNFKIGDKVTYRSDYPAYGPQGRVGTVVDTVGIMDWLVQFDGWEHGHAGSHVKVPDGTGWWCRATELTLLEEPTPSFQVGDRIRIVRINVDRIGPSLGAAGVIRLLGGQALAAVEFDESFAGAHDCGNGLKHGWIVTTDLIEKIEDARPERIALKVGDIVTLKRLAGSPMSRAKYAVTHIDDAEAIVRPIDQSHVNNLRLAEKIADLALVPPAPPSITRIVPAQSFYIVSLLDPDGNLRPSYTPKKHQTQEAAQKEARRLSMQHIGSTFVVMIPTSGYKVALAA